MSIYFHVFLARLGFNGHGSYFATKKLIKKIKEINPDVIHLHNIHGYYLNLKVLFKYLKNEYKGKIVWTLHDCWAFTGHCSHFTLAKCNKWKKECYDCPQLHSYPKEYFDTSQIEYKQKMKLFLGLENLILVTPSEWLKKLINQSFLKDYPTEVINNGIDLNIFKPTYDSDVYEKYNIPKNKKIVLGVASIWGNEKGLADFNKLSTMLSSEYQIIIVGNLRSNKINDNIIHIERTDNANELAKLYTLAYVFLNLTYEDNYPTVNLESICCNTPVISYDTGGCVEQVKNKGFIVNCGDLKQIIEVLNNNILNKRINTKLYSISNMIDKYIKLYK